MIAVSLATERHAVTFSKSDGLHQGVHGSRLVRHTAKPAKLAKFF